jgi:hypothetical protein
MGCQVNFTKNQRSERVLGSWFLLMQLGRGMARLGQARQGEARQGKAWQGAAAVWKRAAAD